MNFLKNKISFVNKTLIPAFLLLMPPCLVFSLRLWASHCDGDFNLLYKHLALNQRCKIDAPSLKEMFLMAGSSFSLRVLGVFLLWCLFCQRFLPGRICTGTITPDGNLPLYKDNGLLCYVLTMIIFFVITKYQYLTHGTSVTILYDRFDEILSTLNAFSYAFCLILYLKGIIQIRILKKNVLNKISDSSSSGNPIFDYFWGTELYPNLFGWDVKVLTNCRWGMTAWPILVCVHVLKAWELTNSDLNLMVGLLVSATLQIAYITKFFYWESGYYRTLDIILDRAGYYICWGCLVFVPGLYASPTLFGCEMVIKAAKFGQTKIIDPCLAFVIFAIGMICLAINYSADEQRMRVRATHGKTKIWGKDPKLIPAQFHVRNLKTGDLKLQRTILLASGWWSIARHFNYAPELALAFCWCFANAGFTALMPFTYFIHLTILLVHRTKRDDEKCCKKYGAAWQEYKKLVPYEIIPGVF